MTWPIPHFFRVQLVKQGSPCGFKIWYGEPLDPVTGEPLDRSPRWQAELNGESVDPFIIVIDFAFPLGEPDYPYMGERCHPLIKGEEITQDEYNYLVALHNHAVQYDPTMPEADPRKPVNLREMAPVLPPR